MASQATVVHSRSEVDGFIANIEAGRDALGETQLLLDSYRAAAEDAARSCDHRAKRPGGSMKWTRVVVVFLALLIAAGQLVPWWLGSRLVEGGSRPPTTREGDRG